MQVNTAYKAIKWRIDKIQIGVSVTKFNDNHKSFEINDISKTLNNNISEHMIQVIRE